MINTRKKIQKPEMENEHDEEMCLWTNSNSISVVY